MEEVGRGFRHACLPQSCWSSGCRCWDLPQAPRGGCGEHGPAAGQVGWPWKCPHSPKKVGQQQGAGDSGAATSIPATLMASGLCGARWVRIRPRQAAGAAVAMETLPEMHQYGEEQRVPHVPVQGTGPIGSTAGWRGAQVVQGADTVPANGHHCQGISFTKPQGKNLSSCPGASLSASVRAR